MRHEVTARSPELACRQVTRIPLVARVMRRPDWNGRMSVRRAGGTEIHEAIVYLGRQFRRWRLQ
jgi:hypothetical protein